VNIPAATTLARPVLAQFERLLLAMYVATGAALALGAHVASGLASGDGLVATAAFRYVPAIAVAALVCVLLPRLRRFVRQRLFSPLLAIVDSHDELVHALALAAQREEALCERERQLVATNAHGGIATWHYDCETGGLGLDSLFRAWLARDGIGLPRDLSELLAHMQASDAAQVMQGLQDHLAGRTERYEAEFSLTTPDGGLRRYRSRGRGVDGDAHGRPRRVQGILHDITGTQESTAALAVGRDEAARMARVKSAFITSLCHEMRMPLTGVLGMLSLLEHESLTSDQREFVDVALKSGRSLCGLIDNALDLSTLEADAVELELVEFELHALAEDVVEMLAEQAHCKGVDIVLRIEPGLPRRIAGDPVRLRQVLVNLLGNAVRFTERGHAVLDLRAKPAGGGIRFEVADTGIGIPSHRHTQIFEPFAKADGSTIRRYGASGLCLGITRQLVGLMGATLKLESVVGVGSRFSFDLPLGAITAGLGYGAASGALAAKRILVQEPNPVVADACAKLLRKHGALVECIADQQDLRPTLQGARPPVDAVLFDAGSDLFTSAREIAAMRALPALRAVKLIACVPCGRRTDAADARALGADGLVTKPMREARLLRAISDVFADAPASLSHVAFTAGSQTAPCEARSTLAGLVVLVVDDVITNLKVVAGMLAKLGVRAELADSGRAALHAISRTPFPVIFMDCQMPGMDGFEATALIRARQCAVDGPRIIAMSANAASTDRDRCLAHGMDDYLAKPIMLSDLERVLYRWMIGSAPAARSTHLVAVTATALETVDRRKHDELAGLLSAGEFRALCERFTEDGDAQLIAFEAGLEAGDFAAARQAAHALKGAAVNMGAAALATLCRGVEDLPEIGLDGALASIRAAFGDFRAQLVPAATIAA
jgi:signal transduction histidine kinase/DNA-binding response OmpR family regulator